MAPGEEEGGGGAGQKASFFAGGEELQGLLEVLDGCAHVLVLQGAAGVLAQLLRLAEVLRRQLDAACREDKKTVNLGGGQAWSWCYWGSPPVRAGSPTS